MHYIIKVYNKEGRIIYTLKTTEPWRAREHYYNAAKINKEVGKTEIYMNGELIGIREGA